MKIPPALLVDFDGTLADTGEANFRAYAQALTEAGVRIDRKTFDAHAFGRNWRQFLPAMLAQGGAEIAPAEVAARKVAVYPAHFGHVVINHALLAMLAAYRQIGPVALVTTASRANVVAMLAYFGIEELFTTVVTGDDVAAHKPDPEAYQLAAARLGRDASDCVIIEDSDIGVAAGHAFGAPVLRVAMEQSAS